MSTATSVTITFPGSDFEWTFQNAAPSDDGDYSDVNEFQMGMANVGKVMAMAKKELNDYAAEVEQDAHLLHVIKALAESAPTWRNSNPPKGQDILRMYEAGVLGAADIDDIFLDVRDPDIRGFHRQFSLDDIQRVPPDYPDSYASLVDDTVYMRPDGTYFWYGDKSPDGDPILEVAEIDLADVYFGFTQGGQFRERLPGWIESINARKAALTEVAQTQMAYLQDRSEMYDRLIALMTALIEALKKILTNLTK